MGKLKIEIIVEAEYLPDDVLNRISVEIEKIGFDVKKIYIEGLK